MKKMFKRILPCLLIVLSVFTIVSCKDKNKYQYPTEFPEYTNTDVFVEIDNLKVTNKDLYNRLIQSYGLEVLKNTIDAQLLADVVLSEKQEQDFANQILNLKYGTTDLDSLTEEEKAEALKSFEDNMLSNGLHITQSGDNDPLYYENYYRLEFKRYVKTLEVLKAEIKEYNDEALENDEDPYFSDDDYLSYFTANFHKTYKLIIVTFDSEKQAKEVMASCDIDLSRLAGNWYSTSTEKEMTDEQIKDAFKNMYEKVYGQECSGATSYTYDQLYNITSSSSKDGVIATKALELADGEYTHGPLLYTNRYYLMYAEEISKEYVNDTNDDIKFADTDEYIKEKDAKNNITAITDALKDALYEDVIISSIISDEDYYDNTIARVMNELRQEAGLEIFAEGLEVSYKLNYNSAYSALDITDYDAFKATSNTSKTEVAKWNGGSLTVDQMFEALSDRYGALVTLLFMQQYVVLNSEHNTVVNYVTGDILDQDKYNDYVEADIDAYKESFEEGNFASYGFPAEYGWSNFLRDYIGLSSEAAIIVDFNSTLYEDVLALYTKALYTAEIEDVQVVVLTDENNKKTWGLKSDKWTQTHDTNVEVIDETKVPTLSIAWENADVENINYTDSDGESAVPLKQDYYGHFILNHQDENNNAVKTLTSITVDQAVLEEYDVIYDETFSATASGLYVYYDANLDGVADEVSEADATLASELIYKLWSLSRLEDNTKTIAENLTKVVRAYNLSNSAEYAVYKQAGIRVKIISDSTYSNSTTADEKVLELVKNMWSDIVNYTDEFGTTTSITGQSLDPVYRYIKNNKVFTVNAFQFSDKYQPVYAENGYYQLAVTKATSRTAYEYSTSTKTQKPSLYYYEQYQLDTDDREVTINCSSQITSYYTPAITRLSNSTVVNNELMKECYTLLSKVTFSSNNEVLKNNVEKLIKSALAETDE